MTDILGVPHHSSLGVLRFCQVCLSSVELLWWYCTSHRHHSETLTAVWQPGCPHRSSLRMLWLGSSAEWQREEKYWLIAPSDRGTSAAGEAELTQGHKQWSCFKIQGTLQSMPFLEFLQYNSWKLFFAANRINSVLHKWSRISFSLIQLGANCQQENFQLS